jgi:HPt (histidine-containing phosphotransfer) domain-containing protein
MTAPESSEPKHLPETAARLAAASSPAGRREAAHKRLLELVGGDAKFLRRVAGIFLRDAPKRLAEIRRAVRVRDAEAVAAAAHALKGSAAIFQEEGVVAVARELEVEARAGSLGRADVLVARMAKEYAALARSLRQLIAQPRASPGKAHRRPREA